MFNSTCLFISAGEARYEKLKSKITNRKDASVCAQTVLSAESIGAEQDGRRSLSQVKGDLLTAPARSLLSLFLKWKCLQAGVMIYDLASHDCISLSISEIPHVKQSQLNDWVTRRFIREGVTSQMEALPWSVVWPLIISLQTGLDKALHPIETRCYLAFQLPHSLDEGDVGLRMKGRGWGRLVIEGWSVLDYLKGSMFSCFVSNGCFLCLFMVMNVGFSKTLFAVAADIQRKLSNETQKLFFFACFQHADVVARDLVAMETLRDHHRLHITWMHQVW